MAGSPDSGKVALTSVPWLRADTSVTVVPHRNLHLALTCGPADPDVVFQRLVERGQVFPAVGQQVALLASFGGQHALLELEDVATRIGIRNTENFIAIADLRMSKLTHLPTSSFEQAKPSGFSLPPPVFSLSL